MGMSIRNMKYVNNLASMLDMLLNGEVEPRNKKIGFILTVFPFGERTGGETCTTISNAHPVDVAVILDGQASHALEQVAAMKEAPA